MPQTETGKGLPEIKGRAGHFCGGIFRHEIIKRKATGHGVQFVQHINRRFRRVRLQGVCQIISFGGGGLDDMGNRHEVNGVHRERYQRERKQTAVSQARKVRAAAVNASIRVCIRPLDNGTAGGTSTAKSNKLT